MTTSDGLLVSMSAAHGVGRIIPIAKTIKNWYKLPPYLARGSQAVQPDCVKGQAGYCVELSMGACTINLTMGLVVRLGYCIPAPEFYPVLHGFRY